MRYQNCPEDSAEELDTDPQLDHAIETLEEITTVLASIGPHAREEINEIVAAGGHLGGVDFLIDQAQNASQDLAPN